MIVCECGPARCAIRNGTLTGGRGHGVLCRRDTAGDKLLTDALSGIRDRPPLDAETAELNIRLAAHIMALDVDPHDTVDALRRIIIEIESL